MPLRLVMMGTGDFALPTFEALLASRHEVVALVTQPDRTGSGHHRHVNSLKEAALAGSVTVLQPEKVNDKTSLETLRSLAANLFVVAAYGQILSAELMEIPPRGAINLHGSLLPKYRGAAPVQYAVWNGEAETGVTIFQIQPRLDAGPILGSVVTPVGLKETSGELHDRLAQLAAPLTLSVLDLMENDRLAPVPQDPDLVTRAPRIRKEQGQIDWHRDSLHIGWHVRAMQPWPTPWTWLHLPQQASLRMLILDVDPVDEIPPGILQGAGPGAILPTEDGTLCVRTGDGAVRINRLQPAGKRPMSAGEFLRGTSVTGGHFGPES